MLGGSETLSDGCRALPESAKALLNNNAAANAITAWQLFIIAFPYFRFLSCLEATILLILPPLV